MKFSNILVPVNLFLTYLDLEQFSVLQILSTKDRPGVLKCRGQSLSMSVKSHPDIFQCQIHAVITMADALISVSSKLGVKVTGL